MVVAVTGRAGYTVDQEDEKVVAELVFMVVMVVMVLMVLMVENCGDSDGDGDGSAISINVCDFATGNGWNDVHQRG